MRIVHTLTPEIPKIAPISLRLKSGWLLAYSIRALLRSVFLTLSYLGINLTYPLIEMLTESKALDKDKYKELVVERVKKFLLSGIIAHGAGGEHIDPSRVSNTKIGEEIDTKDSTDLRCVG